MNITEKIRQIRCLREEKNNAIRAEYNGTRPMKSDLGEIAHVYDENPENCEPSNLMALCCFCHNGLDARMRAEHARATRLAKDKSLKLEFKD